MIWYPFYVQDYQKDTANLTPEQHGIYRLLIDHYYLTEQPLTKNISELCRILRIFKSKSRSNLIYLLKTFFSENDKVFYHVRIDEEIQKYNEIRKKNTENIKKRWEKSDTNRNTSVIRLDIPNGYYSQSQSDIKIKTNTTHSAKTFAVPAYIRPDTWKAFLESRKKKRASNTDYALSLVIKKLEKLRDTEAGRVELLNYAIEKGWTTVFEPQEFKGKSNGIDWGTFNDEK